MHKIARSTIQILAVAGAALLGQLVLGAVLTAMLGPSWPESPAPQAVLPPLALAQLLMILALWGPTRWSNLPKRSLVWALFAAIFGLGVVLTHIEAAVFLVMTTDQLLFGFLSGTLQALWIAWLMATVFGRGSADPSSAPSVEVSLFRWRRLVICSISYLALYFVAGMTIYPHVADYYATQRIPPIGWLIVLQLVRGTLYVLFVSSLLRSSTLGRKETAWVMAAMFPVLAGAASLLVPNGLMPDAVRFWHMIEIGVSNFLFGALVGALFWPGRQASRSSIGLGRHPSALSPIGGIRSEPAPEPGKPA